MEGKFPKSTCCDFSPFHLCRHKACGVGSWACCSFQALTGKAALSSLISHLLVGCCCLSSGRSHVPSLLCDPARTLSQALSSEVEPTKAPHGQCSHPSSEGSGFFRPIKLQPSRILLYQALPTLPPSSICPDKWEEWEEPAGAPTDEVGRDPLQRCVGLLGPNIITTSQPDFSLACMGLSGQGGRFGGFGAAIPPYAHQRAAEAEAAGSFNLSGQVLHRLLITSHLRGLEAQDLVFLGF